MIKGPAEIRDITYDWSSDLGEDTVADSTWDVPDGLVGADEGSDDTTTTVRVSGGVPGERYNITNTVTTSSGQRFVVGFRLLIRRRVI